MMHHDLATSPSPPSPGSHRRMLIGWLLCLAILLAPPAMAEDELPQVMDFSTLGLQAQQQGRAILVMFAATYCEYCERLEQEQLLPLRISGEAKQRILIRKHIIDRIGYIKDFSGKLVSFSDFADDYDIDITPTIVFFNGQGQAVGRRLYGYNGSDFFAARLEQAMAEAYEHINPSP